MALIQDTRSSASAPTLPQLLAGIIAGDLAGAEDGHCVRVNHLDAGLAQNVLEALATQTRGSELTVAMLAQRADGTSGDSILSDRAIEIRNRKQGVFCLFVPAGAHDATTSSLGNSFAEINGPELIESGYTAFIRDHASERVRKLGSTVNGVFATVGAAARPATIDRLRFVIAGQQLEDSGQIDRMGLELWRLGLIPDARPHFDLDLRRNRQAVSAIARPAKLMASIEEKLSQLRLTPEAERTVIQALRGLNLHNPKAWCKELLDRANGTFDRWVPIENPEPTDCDGVNIIRFRTDGGAINPKIKGLEIDAPGGALFAPVGDKRKLRLGWETEPKNTTVAKWLLEMVPVGEQTELDDLAFELPFTEIKQGGRRTGALSLDLGLDVDDELPRGALQVRLSALSESGETLINRLQEPLVALSDEFYLRAVNEDQGGGVVREHNRSANTLAEGMLRAVALHGATRKEMASPAWTSGTPLSTFSMRATDRDTIRIPFNTLLNELQDKTLALPQALGIWRLEQDDLTPALTGQIQGTASPTADSDEENRYLNARKAFFTKVRDQEIRNRVEVADWSADLIDAAVAHARAWVKWLDAASGDDLLVARSVDSLGVRIGPETEPLLAARIVLPTHPLRALWFANHATLLAVWMDRLAKVDKSKRKRTVDLEALANVAPTNVPPLLHHIGDATPYVFYRNLDAGHGVAFPSSIPNPGEQFARLGIVLGSTGLEPISDGRQSVRAAKTTQRFHDAHPYADPFKLALVNPDDGTFAEQMLRRWEADLAASRPSPEAGEEQDSVTLPGLFITSYTRSPQLGQSLRGLERRRQSAEERAMTKASDHLRPSLSLVETDVETLAQPDDYSTFSNEHHLALIQDISRSAPRGYSTTNLPSAGSGLGLHGLVARFSTLHQRQGYSVQWLHWIDTPRGATPHPMDKRLSDGMVEAHRAAGAASGRLLNRDLEAAPDAFSAIGVYLDAEDLDVLRHVHHHADWVLIVDRFFGAELFDTPKDTVLGEDHRTYILDASPDFQDGMGHRSLVTTSSRDEVEAILMRAMGRFGFEQLNESVGSLIQTLKMVSGRLVLDALQTDSRAREVVALGAVVTWLHAQDRLKDTIIIPVDSHLDLFRPGTSDPGSDQKRCDLALFRFVQNRLTITLVEVKSRSSLADLDGLTEHMAAQMDATSSVIEHRYFNDELRIDSILQRSLLAHVLRFYLDRAERYSLVDRLTAMALRKKVDQLESGKVQANFVQQGFIIALDQPPPRSRIVVDDRTAVQILTIAEIAAAANGALCAPEASGREHPDGSAERTATVAPEIDDGVESAHGNRDPEIEAAAAVSVTPIVDTAIELNDQRADDAPNDRAIAPTESETEALPSDAPLPDQDIVIGDSNESPVVWRPRTKGSPHLFILGIPGQGKTVTTEHILVELAYTQTPALVLDFHGTFADPNSAFARVARPVILDASQGLPFSPFEIDPRSSWNEVQSFAKEIADVIDHVFGLGNIQADVVYTTIRDQYRRLGFSDVDDNADLPAPPSLVTVARALERRAKDSGVKNVIARTRALFDFDLFKPPAGDAPAFEDLLEHGVVVGLNKLGGDELALALSAFLLRTVYLSMTKWPLADRIRLVIVLDEAHKLARDVTLPKLMKEGRKYGVAIVVASQGLADFHPDVVGNAGTKVSFRVNNPDSRKVSQFFKARAGQDLVNVLERLNPAQAMVQTPEMPYAVKVQMKMSGPPATD